MAIISVLRKFFPEKPSVLKCTCNICLHEFKEFLPYGRPPRASSCPLCKSDERTRHLYFLLLPLLQGLSQKTVLHMAPEKQLKQILRASSLQYFDCDLHNASYIEDITQLSFPDNFFDMTICMHVFEHVLDDTKGMAELYRVLKPGGKLFTAVPLVEKALEDYSINTPDERLRVYGERDHVRYYDHALFLSRLVQAGFTVQWSAPEKFPSQIRQIFNLGTSNGLSGSKIYICSKQVM